MNSSEKKFLVTCLVGVSLYLMATLWFLSQPGCAPFMPDGTRLDLNRLYECSTIAQDCIDRMRDNKEFGDNEQLVLTASKCTYSWIQSGCNDIVGDLRKAIE